MFVQLIKTQFLKKPGFLLLLSIYASGQTVLEHHELPMVLEETSGLTQLNDTLWTHNDSGNEAALYAISPTGKIIATKKLSRHQNIDWEDITTDGKKLLVGDMGNNFGTRKNLYVVAVDVTKKEAIVTDSIPFHYPEQHYFGFQQETSYDAEAIIYIENKIVLFTKNRSTLSTEIYVLNKKDEKAKKISSIPVGALITAADYHTQTKTLALVGYLKSKHQFLYRIKGFDLAPDTTFSIESYKLPFKGAQIEAVSFIDANTVWITSEKTSKYAPFLAKISFD